MDERRRLFMANRPIYHIIAQAPYYEVINTDFKYYCGLSVSQKQKSILSLHEQYILLHPDYHILEISSKSPLSLGISLSAFDLETKHTFSVECVYHSSKVFENGGPYTDLLEKTSREAKKDPRLHESGKLIGFHYFDMIFPSEPDDYFYNWLYINALYENKELTKEIINYDSFTDIEFNPKKSINCQAKAAAIFVSLYHQNLLNEALKSRESFYDIVYGKGYSKYQ